MWRLVTSSNPHGEPHLHTLNNFVGRQTWEFEPNGGTPEERKRVEDARKLFVEELNSVHKIKHSGDELLRLQAWDKIQAADIEVPTGLLYRKGAVSGQRVEKHVRAGIRYYQALQQDEGFWGGDYGGPLFLFPALVIAAYVTGKMGVLFPEPRTVEALRYLRNHQNQDGGYGLHIEGRSTMFGTCLNYVAIRLLGVAADDPMAVKARAWMHERGGAKYCTSWGKFWLCVLGVYSWDGINPLQPEMWLLPRAMWTGVGMVHPSRMWCHCRMVYLPMSYIYGRRDKLTSIKPSELVMALRSELYTEPYDTIKWSSCRNLCAKEDLYFPHPLLQNMLWWILSKAEWLFKGSLLRKCAIKETFKHIEYEDENTRYICIGPVNKVANMICRWMDDPESEGFQKHLARVPDYLWVAEDGLKMQGYNGSQLWDTAFAVQAICCAHIHEEFADCLKKAHGFLEKTQVIQEVPGPLDTWYRHKSKGAWPFSTRDHGWPISDCTSEGLKAVLLLSMLDSRIVGKHIPKQRLYDCVDVILSYQNPTGGMATYELTRSFPWIEIVNPSETFGDIVIDYPYVECTSACVTALSAFSKQYPDHRVDEIEQALKKAKEFLLSIQAADGSWYGSWGVCFTYGTWFGICGLASFGGTFRNNEPVRRACTFLLERQKKDGGWGESYLSCEKKVYSQLFESHVVNTSWAMLALMTAQHHLVNPEPVHRGARYLVSMQNEAGDWPQQHISGVFNRNCMISYSNYRYIFPIWALAMYHNELGGSD